MRFWCGEGSNFGLFHWLASSPLKHSRTTVRVCDNTQDDIYTAITYGTEPYARVHFGSCEWKSVSARWPPTRRPSCKLDLWVRPYTPNICPSPCIIHWRRKQHTSRGEQTQGSGGRKSPSGVQGRSPGKGLGTKSPRSWKLFEKYVQNLVKSDEEFSEFGSSINGTFYLSCGFQLKKHINFCKIWAIYAEFLAKMMHFFMNQSVDVATYFIILSCSLHLKTAFCTVALMTVYTAEYLLVLACIYTAGITKQSCLTKTTVENSIFHDSNEHFNC